MARVKPGMSSELSGKLRDVVYVNLNGKTYVRSAPEIRKDSRTRAQLLNQQRFKRINEFCVKFKYTAIPRIWNLAADFKRGYALFLKTNTPVFAKDGSVTDPRLIKLSTGKLTIPQEFQSQRMAEGSPTIQVSWKKDSHLGGLSLKDELLCISAADGLYSEIIPTGMRRVTLGGSFELPAQPAEATHLYLFFSSHDQADYSESVCFEI